MTAHPPADTERPGMLRAILRGVDALPRALARFIDEHPVWSCAAIGVAHAVAKGRGLGERSVWFDEATTISRSLQTIPGILEASSLDQNPPFHFILMSAWVGVFGITEAAVRSSSVLASSVTAVLVLLFARRFFGREAALFASFLFAASAVQATYATEARAYALTSLLCVASFHLYLWTLTRPSWAAAVALGVVNAIAAYTHFTILFALVAQLACASLFLHARRGVAAYVGSQALAFALFAPWLGFLWTNVPQPGRFWLRPALLPDLHRVLVDFAGNEALLWIEAALFLAAPLLLVVRGDRPGETPVDPRRFAVVAAWAFLPVAGAYLVSGVTPVFLLRYVLYAQIGWILLLAAIVCLLPLGAAGRLAVAVGLSAFAAASFDLARPRNADWKTAVERVQALPAGEAAVIVAPIYQCLPFAYYFDRPALSKADAIVPRLAASRVFCLDSQREIQPARLEKPRWLVFLLAKQAAIDPRTALVGVGGAAAYTIVEARELPGIRMFVYRRRGGAWSAPFSAWTAPAIPVS